ncbi:thiamine phosphate synthase [Corynebacterium sp. HMSC05E07]|uniref:thiamine phosphate synthase n=1 Tax=Corynebacterium sp. HMSC05E07 TaxID=1581117 RepID=UPI0008A218D3|nr:thiamine phosphate synthase [Corynebacterium sp. HMSC05E07]OFT63376.1 thiamine phosphate synthase [Corynebacterium sp. HMSC05E07]
MPDLRCYFVTGAADSQAEVVRIAAAAARGGAGVVQVRSKPITARDLYLLGKEVARAVASANPETRVLIDDRVDVALALRHDGEPVHGVHIGQDDLPVAQARAVLGPEAIIGLTTGTRELVENANQVADLIDYIGCGPFRATPTKDSGRAPLGLEAYPELAELSRVPLVAIGDVTADDAADLAATGVAGLAVVRGIMHATDPEAYCRSLISGFDEGSR